MTKPLFFLTVPALLLLAFLVPPALSAQNDSASPVDPASSTRTVASSPCGPAGCIVYDDTRNAAPVPAAQAAPQGARPLAANGAEYVPADDPGGRARRVDEPYAMQTTPSVRTAGPLNGFQRFVLDSTGSRLPIYGENLFQNTPASFLPVASVSPPADYLIGTGDQIKLRTWGNVEMDVTATVDRNGQIFVPRVGTLPVAGLRADELQNALRSAIAKQFRSFDLSATLGQLRSIQIFVLGQAQRPGVHTISSLSTLVNALFATGGPSATGTMRDIQVKRGGAVLTHFDVYDLLMNGDKSKDVHLLPGDILYIPVVGPQVAVAGDVTVPAIYELKGPTTAGQALEFAGGLTPVAGITRASLDRIVDHTRRTVEDFSLNGAQRLIPLQDGDILRVFPVAASIAKAVTLSGYVGDPGRYEWHPGMRIADLIPNRRFLLTRNYFNQKNALNPPVSADPFAVSATEPQRAPNLHALTSAQAAAAATTPEVTAVEPQPELVSHETEINWNYASIERLGEGDLTPHLISVALGEAIDHPDSPENRLLEPGDVVMIYSVRDINLPTELRARFVRIDGEVMKPGLYRLEGNQDLRELVMRAGGLAPNAYPYAAQLTRESVRIAEEIKLQDLVQRETQAVLSPVNIPQTADGRGSTGDLDIRRAYLQALRQVHATGRVILQISPEVTTANELPPFAMHDGDRFFVPAVPNTVDVLGNVFNQGSLRYVRGMRVGDYLKAVGGHTREADKAHDFVLRADGTVLSREGASRFDRLLLYPGDSIIVPGRFKPGFNLVEALSIAQLSSNLAIAAAAVSALR